MSRPIITEAVDHGEIARVRPELLPGPGEPDTHDDIAPGRASRRHLFRRHAAGWPATSIVTAVAAATVR